jgi:hypothetical protein
MASPPFEYSLEFLVDPFFRKTTQLFDEASARGMLLNNLPVNFNHLISLDAAARDSEFVRKETQDLTNPRTQPRKQYLNYVKGEAL